MDEKNNVPYIVYEGEQARNERHIKRLVIALVVAVLLIFASNVVWLYAWLQFDYVGEATVTKDVLVNAEDGVANYVGHNGDIVNGKYPSNNEDDIQTGSSTEEGR